MVKDKVYATPAAKRIAEERGVVLRNIAGSGPDGRIQAADVLAAAERYGRGRVRTTQLPSGYRQG